MESYTLVKENGKFGISKGEVTVLTCKYDAIWRFNDSLLGFREDEFYGLFSLKKGKVLVEPVLFGKYIFYSQYIEPSDKARFKSCYGIHKRESIFIEHVHQFLKEDDITIAQDDKHIYLVEDQCKIRRITEDNEDAFLHYMFKLQCLSFIQTADGEIVKHQDDQLPFYSPLDEELHKCEHPFYDAVSCINFMKHVDKVLEEQGVEGFDYFNDPDLPTFREFNYDVIPADILKACKIHLNEYYEVEPDSEFMTENLIYLAWLFANNFVVVFDDGLHMVDGRFEYEDVDGEGGTRSLDVISSEYDLDKIIPFLKISDITQGYLPVLVCQN